MCTESPMMIDIDKNVALRIKEINKSVLCFDGTVCICT